MKCYLVNVKRIFNALIFIRRFLKEISIQNTLNTAYLYNSAGLLQTL